MSGILASGAYLPRHRLDRGAITAALGKGRGRGTRAVAGFDEDTTTLGVEAARIALAGAPEECSPQVLYFATAAPAYMQKTNATAIHAALDLDRSVGAFDAVGSVHSGAGALRCGLHSPDPALVVLADVRTGRSGGADERDGGDAGAALLLSGGSGPFIAELIGQGTATDEFIDRWAAPGARSAHRWEEHFGATIQVELGAAALADALAAAGLAAGDVDRLLVAGTNARALKAFVNSAGVPAEAVGTDFSDTVGNAATAHAGLLLAAALEQAGEGEAIVLVVLDDGAEAFVFRTTAAIAGWQSGYPVADQLAAGASEVSYADFLAWRGMLEMEPTRRPPPAPPVAPASHRTEGWKFAFHGGRCQECGALQVPAQKVCFSCQAVDRMEPVRLADRAGTVVTMTVDRLAWTPSPPAAFAIVDLDGGGRVQLEVTDADPGEIAPGQRMELTFRCAYTRNDVHNYIWKARPLAEREES